MRETFQIKNFNYGVISTVDAEDIPPESASDSLNVDGDVGEGRLQGIPTDTEMTVNSSASLGNIKLGAFIEKDTLYDFIYHDSANNKLRAIASWTTTTGYSLDLATGVSDSCVIIPNNKEVHIGTGTGEPKWIGYCGHGQFGNGTSWAISNATNASPIVVTAAGHSLKDGNLVKIAGVLGNTAANGIWVVASSDPAAGTFALSGSTGNGAYSAGTDTATQHLCIESAVCDNYTDTGDGSFYIALKTETTGSDPKYFKTTSTYYYAMSYIYDGYQESPLTDVAEGGYPNPFAMPDSVAVTPTTNDREYLTLTVTAYGADDNEDAFNKRITGVNVYRAESDSTTSSGRGLYRLVCTIDINDTGWTAGSGNKTIDIIDRGIIATVGAGAATNFGQVTYEQNSGIPENVNVTRVKYSLACKGEGYLFVGKCTKADIPDADRFIFRSKELRYDMFNWTSDFLVMPEPITAMEYFGGRLYVFSLNKVYRIHPDMYIEDVFEGAGALGQRSCLLTEYGLYFANKNGAYHIDNSGQIDIISRAIQRSSTSGRSWRTFDYAALANDIPIYYSSPKKYVMFFNSDASGEFNYLCCWAYNVMNKRWDFWTFTDSYDITTDVGFFTDKDGYVYLSIAAKTYRLMANTGYQKWEWFSQDLSFGETRQKKSIVMIKTGATGTVSITYGVDGATPATSGTSESLINVYNKSIRIKLSAASGTNYCDSLEVIYRPLKGKR